MSEEQMRVWAVDDVTWYAGATGEACVQAYRDDLRTRDGKSDADETIAEFGDPVLVSDADMERLTIVDVDEPGQPKQTFAQALRQMIDNGAEFPRFFCSTEY